MTSGGPITVVSGASKCIGKFITENLLKKGHTVIGFSRGQSDITNSNYHHQIADVTSEPDVRKVISFVSKEFGRLDHLINNAGIASMNHSLLMPTSSAEKIISTNFIGTFLLCREAARVMQRNKFGRIINFSTVAVPFELEGEAIYAASKAAVESLTRILAKELSSFGITINIVGPSPIETDLIRNVPPDKIKQLIDKQTIKRMGQFDDVLNVIEFFMKPESSFITGQKLYLGGA